MPAAPSFESSWASYQEAVNDLYSAPAGITATADRSPGEIYASRLEERSDTLIERSEEVREALTSSLESEDLDERELAALKLLAAAMYDMSVANDLLQLENVDAETYGEDGSGRERAARSVIMGADDLQSVLAAPMSGGMKGLLKDEVEREALPDDPAAAKQKLEKTIKEFLKEIPEGAAGLGQKAVSGVLSFGFAPVQNAAAPLTQEILSHVPNGISFVGRRIAKLFVEALRKIQTALGGKQSEEAQKEAAHWLEKTRAISVVTLLGMLYETARIEKEVQEAVEAAAGATDATPFNKATRSLQTLQASYRKTQSILSWGMRILSFVHKPLLAFTPWGPLAVYVAYAGVLGYAVYNGGDYLDWYRLESTAWLDRVVGLRATVRGCCKG